ncbi:MAG: transposase, partial [Gammaproteobacteria bacterium]|nr:transposase [Gammaproteobacteria bacterium]
DAARIGLETGPTATWLWHELKSFRLPVICIDARHAKAALSMQINKSDRNDAVGIARIMQCGWYKEVQVKRLSCHEMRAILNSRALLIKIKMDLENQIRGLLKNLGLLVGKGRGNVFRNRVAQLLSENDRLSVAVLPLLQVREKIASEIADLTKKLRAVARDNVAVRRSRRYRASGRSRPWLSTAQSMIQTGSSVPEMSAPMLA